MQNNRLVINDTEYVLDAAYRRGAHACRDHIPYSYNPHHTMSDQNSQWNYGHENEDVGMHVVDGVDIILATRNGTTYHVVY